MTSDDSAISGGRRPMAAGDQAADVQRPRVTVIRGGEARTDLLPLQEFLASYFTDIAGGEFEVTVRCLPRGAGGVRQAATRLLSESLGLAAAAEAEAESDLIIFNDWAMPVLQARSWLRVPVTCVSEASVVLGNVLARRPAIVTVGEGMRPDLERDLAVFGLRHRLVQPPVWWLEPESTQEDVLEAVTNPGSLIERFDEVARRAVDAGADAILVGCGSYGPIFARHNYRYVSGHLDVPVFDCGTLAMEFGRTLYRLHRIGLEPSNRGYRKPGGTDQAAARLVMTRLVES
jgi:Asp/Glu/hydantoin racemase